MFKNLRNIIIENISNDWHSKITASNIYSYNSPEGRNIIEEKIKELNGKPPIIAFLTTWFHNSGIAIGTIKDGKAHIICNNEQERFGNRNKYTYEFPVDAIKSVIYDFDIKGSDIDLFCSTWNPSPYSFRHFLNNLFDYFPSSLKMLKKEASPQGSVDLIMAWTLVSDLLKDAFKLKENPKIITFDHHLMHASSFYLSPFEEALTWVCDGYGDTESVSVWLCKDKSIEKIWEENTINSLGLLYCLTSYYCGFQMLSGEGKLMGLAAFGDPEVYYPVFEQIVNFTPENGLKIDFSLANWTRSGVLQPFTKKFSKLVGPPVEQNTPFYFDPMDELTKRRANIAAALQKRFQEVVYSMISYFMEKEKQTNIVMAGGSSLNCPTNQMVVETDGWKLFIPPNPSDSGTDFAGVINVLINYFGAERPEPLEHPYFCGKEYTIEEMEAEIKQSGLRYRKKESMEEIYSFAAGEISKDKIIAWFQGRAETGPRALGNRSILSNPANPEIREIINNKVKLRELYRPLCPSVLIEHFKEWFYTGTADDAPFMTTTFRIKEQYFDKVKAVVHKDGTCRVQTVSYKQNPHFYNLITHFYNLTGIPMVLNTSFNIAEPIVQSPYDALKTFKRSSMDFLIMGPFIIKNE